jgi:glycerophosphoryl diester phosphodiesterase
MHPAVAADRPLIFAHRGGAGLAPENTVPAFDRGLALGADGLELDVHLSRDGVPVVHHDALLERTTDAFGPVCERSVSELARVNACAGFVRSGRPWDGGPAGVPTLREVLRRYRDTRLIVELKGPSTALARAVVDTVREADAVDRTCIGGFSWRALRVVRQFEPRLATSASKAEVRVALYASRVGLSVRPGNYVVFQVPECAGLTRVVSRQFIRRAHEAHLAVQVWTVNDPADVRRLLDWGADAIITDRPDLAVPTLREWMAGREARRM